MSRGTGFLALTPAGTSLGFSLSTFVGPYGLGNYGPLSQAILPSGNVVTGSVGDSKIYVFKDVDGQSLGDAISATPYACETGNCNYAMATAGGQAYGAQLFGGIYYKFANDGSRTPIGGATATDLRGYLGMWNSVPRGPEEQAADGELREWLKRCAEGLTVDQRAAFHLKAVEGRTTAEVCKIVGVSSTNLGVLLFRARNKLRECLEKKWMKR